MTESPRDPRGPARRPGGPPQVRGVLTGSASLVRAADLPRHLPRDVADAHLLVVPDPEGRGFGLLRAREARARPDIAFGELVAGGAVVPVRGETPIAEALRRMDREGRDALPVVDDDGAYLGCVERASLMLEQQRATRVRAVDEADALLSHVDAAHRRRALAGIVHAMSERNGEDYLSQLVCNVARALGVKRAFVGTVREDAPGTMEAVAVGSEAGPEPSFQWQTGDTPCPRVFGGEVCVIEGGLDRTLPGLGGAASRDGLRVESYAAVPLLSDQSQVVGLLAVVHDGPLPDPRLVRWLLPVFAGRAVSEMERIQALDRLRRSEQRYRMLLEQASDGIMLCDASGRYVDVNAQACAITGYPRAELLSLHVRDLIPADDLARKPMIWPTLQEGEVASMERWFRRRDASKIPVEVSARRLADGSTLAIVRDISERKRVQERLDAYYQLLHTIHLVQSRYIAEAEPQSLFDFMLTRILHRTESTVGFLGEVTEDEQGRRGLDVLAVELGPGGERRRDPREPALGGRIRDMDSLLGAAAAIGAPVISNHAARDPRGGERLPAEFPPLDNFMGLPLYVGGRLIGVAGVGNRPGGYEERTPDFLEPLTTTYATILERHRSAQRRQSAEDLAARLGRILDQTGGEILVFGAEDEHFVEANRGAQAEVGYTLDELRELTLLDLLPHISREHLDSVLEALQSGEKDEVAFETLQRRKFGSVHPVEVRLQYSHVAGQGLFVALIRDISARKRFEGQVTYLIHYDSLTGLPNRMLLGDRIKQAIIEAERDGRHVGIIFLDLDRFKQINDTLGHDAGDALLGQFADRLKEVIRPGDTVARPGGDEFTLVLTGVDGAEGVARTARRIADVTRAPFRVKGQELFITVSMGISLYPEDARDEQGLLRSADTALHDAKNRGRDNFQFFRAEMNQRVTHRLSMETHLRRAMDRGEFEVYYQPKVHVQTGAIVGAEALLRWHHPELGEVPPARFIPRAEETGLIVPIGDWVLEQACADCRSWRQSGHTAVSVAVNVSPRQLGGALPKRVVDALHRAGLPASALELELTESLLVTDDPAALADLAALRDTEVSFLIDDFGTGYSSLMYLKRFPFDSLKLDRTFMHEIPDNTEDAAIARAIVAMGHSLGLSVVAEGVETQAQLEFLQAQGCDSYQGFLFAEPVPSSDFLAMLNAQRRG